MRGAEALGQLLGSATSIHRAYLKKFEAGMQPKSKKRKGPAENTFGKNLRDVTSLVLHNTGLRDKGTTLIAQANHQHHLNIFKLW
jgi:phage gpG-like protein